MELTNNFLIIIAGAYAISLLNLVEALRLPVANRPEIKSFAYLGVNFLFNPLIAAIVGYCYTNSSDTKLGTMSALQIGASAPLILRGLASATGATAQKKGED